MTSQTAGLGDKGNPQVAKEFDKLGNHQWFLLKGI